MSVTGLGFGSVTREWRLMGRIASDISQQMIGYDIGMSASFKQLTINLPITQLTFSGSICFGH